MKIICIADTHNKHSEIIVPPGDLIIHAGDFTEAGTKSETLDFLNWFSSLPHKHKILVAGNHDFYLEKQKDALEKIIPANIHYLLDSSVVIEGIKFWGSPYTPGNGAWAFNEFHGRDIKKHWDLIEEDTNFLVTHTPPYKILDELDNKEHIGCEELVKRIKELKIPNHIFGHVHNDYGIVRTANTTFINASSLDNRYRYLNTPLVLHHLHS